MFHVTILLATILLTQNNAVGSPVNSEPGHPYIVQAKEDERMEVQEGEEVELECQSAGGRPPAEIQWWDGEGRRIMSHVTEHVMRMEDRKTFKTVSTLNFKPSGGQQIKCLAHNDAFQAGKVSDPIKIGIRGEPTVEVKELEDGDSLKIFCNKEQQIGDMKLKWFINDVEIFDENKNVLEIQQFSKSYDKSQIKCLVKGKNDQDKVVRIVQLVHKIKSLTETNELQQTFKEILKTKSSFSKNKKTKQTKLNKKKTMFICVTEDDSSAEPQYVWLDGKLKEMTPGEAVDASDQKKKYKCKAIPKGMNKLNKLSKDLKDLTETINVFSKTLTSMTSSIDEDDNTF